MSHSHYSDVPHGNFRTARDIIAEEASTRAQTRDLRGEAIGTWAARLRRALASAGRSYLRGLSYAQHNGFRPF